MKPVEHTEIAVRIMKSARSGEWQSRLQELDIPLRSRLYGLRPMNGGTVWSECLTSYINRLGWRHGISPRTLATQEIGPLLANVEWWRYPSPQLMGVFYAANAMGINGSGNLSNIWSALLEQLTARADLHLLTASWWIGDLPVARNLRPFPAWCPACYAEWKQQGLSLYQPLLWILQVVTICPVHKMRLVEQCPFCQRAQTLFTSDKTRPGECTRCAKWLGAEAGPQGEQMVNEELICWQEWVVKVLQELQTVSLSSGMIHWQAFSTNLAMGMRERGSFSRIARLTGINREVLHRWASGAVTPSFEMMLKFCYICNTTPLQIMDSQFTSLQQAIQSETPPHVFRHHRAPRHRVDYEYCLSVLQAVCDGQEDPVPSICQLAKRLRCEVHVLTHHFPQECAFIAEIAQKHRQQRQEQRLTQVREKVRELVMSLQSQGIYPSHRKLRSMLPSGLMRMPEAHAAWHAALRDLGLEQ